MIKRILVLALLLSAFVPATARVATPAPHTFDWKGRDFLLDGKPFVIRGGEMHFSRVPREHWRDRLRMMKAMGLNTVGTYLFWNLHEPRPGDFDFGGQNDIAAFVRTAQEEGLWVILRPGPYACAEWEFGGFPSWLLKTPDLRIRTADPRYVAAATRFLGEVGKQLAPLQVAHGGPILMVQVENEYGSFGADHGYMGSIRDALRAGGFDGLLYTADGPTPKMLDGGTLPGVLATVNFGSDPAGSFAALEKFRGKDVPRMAGEYYPGWFDHWGEQHHTGKVDNIVGDIGWMLERGISFSLYMFHGGTTFGFMNGANYSGTEPYQPDTSSYDYGAPLDEAGRPMPAYHALRALIGKHLEPGETLPEVPPSPPMITIPRFRLDESAPLTSLLAEPVRATRPLTMEEIDQAYGFVWYRTRVPKAKAMLEAGDVRDMALLYQAGKPLGKMDRRLGQRSIELDVAADQPLDVLVENMGRINYGARLMDERKGLLGPVRFAGQPLLDWQMYRLPLDDLSPLKFSPRTGDAPAFHRGSFRLSKLGDSYIDLHGWDRGHVWVNGHHLGRYWRIGPQQTLLVPAQWLRKGRNEIIVLELEGKGGGSVQGSVQGLADPVFDTPKP